MPGVVPRLATAADIPRLLADDRVTWTWPPPGCDVVAMGFPEPWVIVYGTPPGDPGDWYVTTIEELVGYFPGWLDEVLVQLVGQFTGPIAAFAGSVGNWPVIYEVGEANHMRWISSTFRGTLSGVEEFQFGINWGNPGADPDPNEAEALAMAQDLATKWAVEWQSVTGGSALNSFYPTSLLFTEVGVTVKTQTSPTDASGEGGNLEQKFETQWYAYPGGSRPTGTGGSTSLPFEVACAVTLNTDRRGQSGRGRIYLPPPASSAMDVGGVFQTNFITRAGAAVGRFFVAATDSSGHVPIVVSRRKIYLTEIETITVGKVPDSQRRRRRSQDEARVTAWTKP